MKKKLIALSKERGFKAEQMLFDSVDGLSDKRYYLWMCELQLWMIEVNGLLCEGLAGEHLRDWYASVDYDKILSFETLYADNLQSYSSLPLALEKALFEGLNLTEKK